MRLPRRVPWENLGELEQVCSWIYTDEHDLDAKQRAVNRLAAWKLAIPLPHALESAHAILSVTLQDGVAASSSSYLSLRMSYASAIIRLVNGLVDPLQLGAYARSIHSIAQQLGLPPWLVELRHAATHEDLPSLEVLREAAREAMAWLLHNYFLPTLNPSAPPSAPAPPLRPLAPVLKQYKTLMKATTRDATLHALYRTELTKLMRDVERWIAEAKVASTPAVGGGNVATVGWDDPSMDEGEGEEDAREKWALDRLSEALLDKGALVPLSKRKRLSSDQGQGPLTLPRASVAIWSPLLAHIQALHPALPLHLVTAITTRLTCPLSTTAATGPVGDFGAEEVSLSVVNMDTDETKGDPSYDLCLAAWALWLTDSASRSDIPELKENIIVRIVSTLGPIRGNTATSKAVPALLQAVSADRPRLAAALSVLAQTPGQTPEQNSDSPQSQSVVDVMDTRLRTLLSLQNLDNDPEEEDKAQGTAESSEEPAGEQLPSGWRKLSPRDGWRPAPIGVYVACQ